MILKEEPLTEAVLRRLIAFSVAWERENSCWGYRANRREDIEGNRVFLAWDGEEIIAYLLGHLFSAQNMRSVMPEGTNCFEAEELYVIPSRRSQGVGKALFDYVSAAMCREAEYIVLSTANKNWRATFHFYLDELGMEFWSARLFKRIAEGRRGPADPA